MYKLTTNDYIHVLNYYNIPIPKQNNKKNIKKKLQKFTKSEKIKTNVNIFRRKLANDLIQKKDQVEVEKTLEVVFQKYLVYVN